MAKKMVRYNGGTESYYGCSDHRVLVKGCTYEVIRTRDLGGHQTNYTLNGIKGEFNSVWFDEITDNKHKNSFVPTFLAVSNKFPEEGKSYECSRMEIRDEIIWTLQRVCTSTVQKVKQIGPNTYHVTTLNSLYIVQVS